MAADQGGVVEVAGAGWCMLLHDKGRLARYRKDGAPP